MYLRKKSIFNYDTDIIWTAEQVSLKVIFQMVLLGLKNTKFLLCMWGYIKYDAHYSGIRVPGHMMY